MIEDCRVPVVGGVAIITEITALDMVIGFAARRLVIVTTEACANNGKMIDAYGVP